GIRRMIGKEFKSRIFELQALTRDKKEFPIELVLRKKIIGERAFYVATIRDITKETEFKKACDVMIEDLEKEIEILNNGEALGSTGSWRWNIDKGTLRTTLGYKNILGLDIEDKEYKAKYLHSRIWPEDEEVVNKALNKAFNEGLGYDIIFRQVRTSDMRIIYIRSIAQPVKNSNGVVKHINGNTRLLQTKNVLDASKNPLTEE
ncbi:MAG: PAS domain-containing protein, partial [Segetibacter sp.]